MDVNSLIVSFFFSMVGIGFFTYGRKNNFYFMISGIVLMVYPYFVSGYTMLISIGILMLIAPFILNWLFPQS